MGLIPGLTQWIKVPVAMRCVLGRICRSDLALLWLWCGSVATPSLGTSIRCRCVSKKPKKKKKEKKERKKNNRTLGNSLVAQWIKDLLWPQVATEAQVQSLAQKRPHATGGAENKKKK